MNLRGSRQGTVSQTLTKSAETKAVAVEIRGQKFSVKSDKDPAHVERLAKFVDQKAAEIQSVAPAVPMDRLMMLVGMTIAEDYFKAQQSLETTTAELERGVEAALSALGEAEREE